MAEVLEPDSRAAEGSEAPVVETPGWEVPEDAGPQQSDPPRPAESDVFIEDRAEMTVFVRSFDGFSSAQKNQEQLLTLASILREEGKVFDEKVYYTAGYNSPFKLLDRNNEVWLIQKNEPSKERE